MVAIPNSVILNSEVVNYSTLAGKQGLILHTTVGIGYENPLAAGGGDAPGGGGTHRRPARGATSLRPAQGPRRLLRHLRDQRLLRRPPSHEPALHGGASHHTRHL
ncbi:MAG: hypothetical protein MZW92_23440 [Comamonadaceae bacterium]|nr:hypothetical protein [Comamonadaceae bacterium]